MHRWKLTKTLTDPKDPEWEMLSHLALGPDVHSDRKMGFLLSREALKNVLAEYGHEAQIADLKLSSHSQILRLPQYTISLSHTKDCGAAMVADRKTFRSVGIDIEHESRPVKDSIKYRIAHPLDESLRNIELWCLKEAAFKAMMNTGLFEKPVEFSSIQIGNGNWSHSPSGLLGEWELETLTPFVVARAFLRN